MHADNTVDGQLEEVMCCYSEGRTQNATQVHIDRIFTTTLIFSSPLDV